MWLEVREGEEGLGEIDFVRLSDVIDHGLRTEEREKKTCIERGQRVDTKKKE